MSGRRTRREQRKSKLRRHRTTQKHKPKPPHRAHGPRQSDIDRAHDEAMDSLVKWGDERLSQKCEPVFFSDPDDAEQLGDHIALLELTARDIKNAAGLAAPQLGIMKRIIVIFDGPRDKNPVPKVMVNPVIEHHSEETTAGPEGCLSYPRVQARVTRYDWIDVVWADEQGMPCLRRFHGFTARVIQHEIDHLSGICKVGDVWRKRNQAA